MRSVFLLSSLLLVAACAGPRPLAAPDRVEVRQTGSGWIWMVGGRPFIVNGMNWDHKPIGKTYDYRLWDEDPAHIRNVLDYEMGLLRDMGVNAIRVYAGIPRVWIEHIHDTYAIHTMLNHSFGRYGLTVDGEWVANTDYADPRVADILLREVEDLAREYRGTRGLLLYLLGNENNYGLFWKGAETEDIPPVDDVSAQRARPMYRLFNRGVQTIRAIDGDRPIAIANGDLQFLDIIIEELPDLDIFGANVYRGPTFTDLYDRVKREYGKPVLLTEFGADAYDALKAREDQRCQAEINLANWRDIYANAAGLGRAGNAIGGFTFQFSDGWWKVGQTYDLDVHNTGASWSNGGYRCDYETGRNNMNEEWFGIASKGASTLRPRAAYYAIQAAHRINPYSAGMTADALQAAFDAIDIEEAVRKARPRPEDLTAERMLGDPYYRAISFGAYRDTTRDIQPTIPELKEDLRILHAMGIRLLRTYNVYLDEATNLLKAIREIRSEDPGFEMYLMLGAWIDCQNAWSGSLERVRNEESPRNADEIARAVALAQTYPDIVKIIAVGNEAMVHWAWEYHVEPDIILKWVRHLQDLKRAGELSATVWITSSDNFASWGGGGAEYHKPALNELIREVDFISMHTYPMHDTHYNPAFWFVPAEERGLDDLTKTHKALERSVGYAQSQYASVVAYMRSLGVEKPVHIGETGWATVSDGFYGPEGSRAVDEYKSGRYMQAMRRWTDASGISMFYFEAFDEPWKDARNPLGSENHFGLINHRAEAKFAIWDLVDAGIFDGLTRDGRPITKTYGGDLDALLNDVLPPPDSP
jgi:exo-beta-1,3-glucanase (GH17 family)